MAAGRSGWHVGSGGSCRHHCRRCCHWRCGRSRGDREAYHGVGTQAQDEDRATHHVPGGGHRRWGHHHRGQGLLWCGSIYLDLGSWPPSSCVGLGLRFDLGVFYMFYGCFYRYDDFFLESIFFVGLIELCLGKIWFLVLSVLWYFSSIIILW